MKPKTTRQDLLLRIASWASFITFTSLGIFVMLHDWRDDESSSHARAPVQLTSFDKSSAPKPTSANSASRYRHRKIQEIQVGDRVFARNPEITDDERATWNEPDWSTWRRVRLEMTKPDGSILSIDMLRPDSWFTRNSVRPGSSIFLDVSEMGARGPAKVVSTANCPPIQLGPGQLVTATFAHPPSTAVLDVQFEDEPEPIGVTENHRFWSVDRGDFAEIGEMSIGERVQTYHGDAKRIVQKLPRPGPSLVYNLEVYGEHVYFVGGQGLLAHNTYPQVPKYYSNLWSSLPKNRINASNYRSFANSTRGWFNKRNSLQSPFSPNADRGQAWKWYQRAKNTTDELVIGEVTKAMRFVERNTRGYQRLWAKPWQLQVNDSWVIGGIERGAKFRVVSNIHAKSYRRTYLRGKRKYVESVFNRELRLLEENGYRFVQDANGPNGTGWMVPATQR